MIVFQKVFKALSYQANYFFYFKVSHNRQSPQTSQPRFKSTKKLPNLEG